jgi:hypothetical protein
MAADNHPPDPSTEKDPLRPEDAGGGEPSVSELMQDFFGHVGTYLSSQWDLACLGFWSLVVRLVFVVSMSVLVVAASVTVGIVAIFFMMSGMAGGIAAMADGRLWVGRLVTGVVVLTMMSGAGGVIAWRYRAVVRDELRKKYEQRDPTRGRDE